MNVQLSKKNGNELRVRVPYQEDWVARIKQMSFRRWDPVDQAWIIPYTTGSLTELLTLFEGIVLRIDEVLLEESELLADYDWRIAPVELRTIAFEGSSWDYSVKRQYALRLKLGGYSRQTIRTYASHMERFYRYYEGHRDVHAYDLLPAYCNKLLRENRSHAYVNQAVSAIKFHLEKVCGMIEGSFSYIRPKKQRKLPNVLSVGGGQTATERRR